MRMSVIRQVALAAGLSWLGVAAGAEPMRFDFACLGNAVESCFVYAEGEISADTDSAFAAFLDSNVMEGNQIVLHSQGGNLGAGVRLGRMIRDAGLTAIVGKAVRVNGSLFGASEWPSGGTCASACAYAFLGGTTRILTKDSRLGFHRFYMGVAGASASAQQVSGQLVSYLVEMGVDPRIFAKASSEGADSMYWVPTDEAESYDLVTPFGYDDFFLEPYGNGVVAASKRKTPPGPYDNVYQITAYCRSGVPKLLFTATYAPDYSESFSLTTDGQTSQIPVTQVTTRLSEAAGLLEVSLTRADADRLTTATDIRTGFHYARASGGSYETRLTLSDMDRKMLSAAFRFCL